MENTVGCPVVVDSARANEAAEEITPQSEMYF